MKNLIFCSFLAAATALPTASAEEEIDIEARKRSVVELEAHIGEREERLEEILEDIRRLDARVEKYIDRLVDRLKSIEDSTDSDARIVALKERTIEGLAKTIGYYVRKRDGVKANLVSVDEAQRKALTADMEAFDKRIEKRVAQIIELTKSFPGHEEVAKYTTWTEESRRGRRSDTKYRINDAWRHNRKVFRHTESQKDSLTEALKKNIESLERDAVSLRSRIERDGLEPGLRQLYEEELASTESLIELRNAQLDDVLSGTGATDTAPVDRDEAYLIAEGIDDSAADLRQDFFEIFAKYTEYSSEREKIARLQANLEARKRWLAENAP